MKVTNDMLTETCAHLAKITNRKLSVGFEAINEVKILERTEEDGFVVFAPLMCKHDLYFFLKGMLHACEVLIK